MQEVTKLSSKGQLVVPKEIREALELDNGDWLVAIKVDDMLVMKKLELIKEEHIKKRLEKVDFDSMYSMLYPEREE